MAEPTTLLIFKTLSAQENTWQVGVPHALSGEQANGLTRELLLWISMLFHWESGIYDLALSGIVRYQS